VVVAVVSITLTEVEVEGEARGTRMYNDDQRK